jgi:hypothetical protein
MMRHVGNDDIDNLIVTTTTSAARGVVRRRRIGAASGRIRRIFFRAADPAA